MHVQLLQHITSHYRVCGKSHGVWSCGEFKQLDVSKRWENAKKLRLCFRCLDEGHLGQYCTRTRVCGLGGCKELHHRLLHSDLSHVGEKTVFSHCPHAKSESDQSAALRKKSENDEQVVQAGSSREGDQKVEKKIAVSTEATLVTGSNGSIALRTIPVYQKNGNKKLRVNALLDDASTKTYLNTDVAAEMGLQGELKKVNVSVLNGQLKSFETTPVECTIESLDGKTSLKVTALTTGKVTGNMRAMDWTTCADEWPHLRNIKFHKLSPRPIVDMLIGLDCADLHFSLQDVRGEPGQPIARLTPSGWTCVGLVDEQQPVTKRLNKPTFYYSLYVTGFAKRGLKRAFINIEKSRFEILITVYLDNAWCLVYQLLHQSIVIQGNSAGALFDGLLAELPAILDSFFHQYHK